VAIESVLQAKAAMLDGARDEALKLDALEGL